MIKSRRDEILFAAKIVSPLNFWKFLNFPKVKVVYYITPKFPHIAPPQESLTAPVTEDNILFSFL